MRIGPSSQPGNVEWIQRSTASSKARLSPSRTSSASSTNAQMTEAENASPAASQTAATSVRRFASHRTISLSREHGVILARFGAWVARIISLADGRSGEGGASSLQNNDIVRALETIATLMEIKDEAYYRVLGYQRA